MTGLNVVPFPKSYCDTEAHLRVLADDVASGEFGAAPHVVVVINGPDGIQVRGLGTTDALTAIATLQLGSGWLVNHTLDEDSE